MHIKEPIFSVDENKMILPWKDYMFSNKSIAAVTLLLAFIIVISGVVDNIAPVKYLISAAVCGVILPMVLVFVRYWHTRGPFTTPLIVDMSSIIAPTICYKTQISWSDVRKVECIWSMFGSNFAPIERNFIVHKKSGGQKRLFIPMLGTEDNKKFLTIMHNISRHHGFELDVQ